MCVCSVDSVFFGKERLFCAFPATSRSPKALCNGLSLNTFTHGEWGGHFHVTTFFCKYGNFSAAGKQSPALSRSSRGELEDIDFLSHFSPKPFQRPSTFSSKIIHLCNENYLSELLSALCNVCHRSESRKMKSVKIFFFFQKFFL